MSSITMQCSPQAIFKAYQGTTVGHALSGGCGHINALESPYSHIEGNSVLKAYWADMLYALCMLGRAL